MSGNDSNTSNDVDSNYRSATPRVFIPRSPTGSQAEQLRSSRQSTLLGNHAQAVNRTTGSAHLVVDFERRIQKDVEDRVIIPADKNVGRIGSRQPVIVGQNTCVVAAASEGKELIIKISWPTANLSPEAKLARRKTREKTRTMAHGRKLDHLPDIPISQDFDYNANSTQVNLVNIFDRVSAVDEEKPQYERRVYRMTVQERLYPLEELRTAQEYAQVFFDILQSAYIFLKLVLAVISDRRHSSQMAL